MSLNNDNINNEPCDGTEPPDWSAANPTGRPGYIGRTDGMDSEYRLGANAKGTVIVNGVNLGPVARLADLAKLAAIGRLAVEARRLYGTESGAWFTAECALGKAADAYLAKQESK